ncbi:hypothetical protein AVEN_108560-1 [Araneus ventricosus]|uniref:Uncharacterized protein n=1 Tax=Araneus ventricosus TaxID=182803 RepID=A0A4Y2T8W4_ARAVE|nr:hypothetical protein AVEN_108560-1 [Araneus ventricosus]
MQSAVLRNLLRALSRRRELHTYRREFRMRIEYRWEPVNASLLLSSELLFCLILIVGSKTFDIIGFRVVNMLAWFFWGSSTRKFRAPSPVFAAWQRVSLKTTPQNALRMTTAKAA